jgi:hypothetical protein
MPGRATTTGERRRRLRALARTPVALGLVAVALAAGTSAGATATARSAPRCQNAFVPAYFYSGTIWKHAVHSKPAPKVMILNVNSGPGNAPLSHFQSLVRQARAAHVTVLGYSATEYGTRPAAAVKTEIRDYHRWYKVSGMFLDTAATTASELPYYRTLTRYIRRVDAKPVIWLNPGAYPDRRYLALANVVMAFEGPYASYEHLRVPRWAARYKPGRFAHVIYRTPGSDLAGAVRLARSRRAGFVYVTNRSGAAGTNPYGALPSYWKREDASVTSRCGRARASSTISVPPQRDVIQRLDVPAERGGVGDVG